MNIIFSTYDSMSNPYYGGGGALVIHQVAKRLTKKYDITVITGKYTGSSNSTIDGVQYKRVGTLINPKIDQFFFHFALPFYVLTEKFDIWFESFTPPFSTSFLPFFTHKPVVGIAQFFNAEEKSKQYKLPFYLFQNFGIKFYKNCVVLTQQTKAKIKGLNPNIKISIIPNGVTMPKIKSFREKNYILFLGRIEINQKGLDLLIEAFSKIAKEVKLNLLIAGNGNPSDMKILRKMIKINNLKDRVKLLGRVEGTKKESLIRNSQFLVMPSRFETQGLVALEAIAFNKPLIVFGIPGFKWISKNVSIKVHPFSVKKYSEAILELSKNRKLRLMISKKMKKLAENYTWGKCAKNYDLVIQKLLK